jgi:hypothetical protein
MIIPVNEINFQGESGMKNEMIEKYEKLNNEAELWQEKDPGYAESLKKVAYEIWVELYCSNVF